MSFARFFVIVPLVLGLGSLAAGADSDGLLLSDDFSTLDPSWGKPDESFWVEGNKLIIQGDANTVYSRFYKGRLFGDASYRVKICATKGSLSQPAGIVFWAADFDNCYAAVIEPDGYVAVFHISDGERLFAVPWKIQPAVKKGLGEVNELRVNTVGPRATLYINNQEICTFRGFPPEGESRFGVRASSGAQASTWQLSDLSISRPETPLLAPPANRASFDTSLLFYDDFSVLDPGWGDADKNFWADGKKLFIRPSIRHTYTIHYTAQAFADADIRANLTATAGGADAFAGLTFWGINSNNCYAAMLCSDGRFTLVRFVNGELQNLVSPALQEAVRQGLGQVNQLRVVTCGDWAAAYVNNQLVGAFQGYPPKRQNLIGVRGESGDEQNTWQFSDLEVRKADESMLKNVVLFSDEFKAPIRDWSETDDYQYLAAGGQFVFKPEINLAHSKLFENRSFRDVDLRGMVCQSSGEPDKGAGLIFWANADLTNYYVLLLQTDGQINIWRSVNDKWLRHGDLKLQAGMKKGLQQWNELRVVTRGNYAAVYLNNQQICIFRGFPPPGESYVGLHANSGAQTYIWSFANLFVRKPDESLLPAPSPYGTDPALLFFDNFSLLDPGWGEVGDRLRIESNALVVQARVNTGYVNFYNGSAFGDADIRVTLSQAAGDADRVAGILFWGVDIKTCYAAVVRADGKFGVHRSEAGKWQPAVAPKALDSVKHGLNQENQLRVVTRGKSATVYINDTEAATFEGQPPTDDSLVGVFVESGANPSTWRFSDFSVSKP